jgi:hypothetical protein
LVVFSVGKGDARKARVCHILRKRLLTLHTKIYHRRGLPLKVKASQTLTLQQDCARGSNICPPETRMVQRQMAPGFVVQHQ